MNVPTLTQAPLWTLYLRILASHPEKVMLLALCNAGLPLLRQWIETDTRLATSGMAFFWLAAAQVASWVLIFAIYGVFGLQIHRPSARLRLRRACLRFGGAAALLFVLFHLVVFLGLLMVATAAKISPGGLLLLVRAGWAEETVYAAGWLPANMAVYCLVYGVLLLLLSCICVFHTSIGQAGEALAAALANLSTRFRLGGWIALALLLYLGEQVLEMNLAPQQGAALGVGSVALLTILRIGATFVEILVLVAIMQTLWLVLADTADEPPPLLTRIS